MSDALSEHIDWIAPERAFAPFRMTPGAILLHGGASSHSRIYANPVGWLEFNTGQDLAVFLAAARAELAKGHQLAGLFEYEFGAELEASIDAPQRDAPVVSLGIYSAWAEFDPVDRIATLHGENAARAQLKARIAGACPDVGTAHGSLSPDWPRETYLAACHRLIDHIRAGDIYQANLSQGFSGTLSGDPWGVFDRLIAESDAPHAAWFRPRDDGIIITNSPERFLKLSNGQVESRPIKGTRPRRTDPTEDRAEAQALAASAKDRAENLMIVDLVRHDLSRVCRPGSVKVPRLNGVESYSNVHHLVSSVTGDLKAGQNALDLMIAAFPPGSITGAPKIRAMQLISAAESAPRRAYCGALGWIGDAGQAMDLNVMIRTLTLSRDGNDWHIEARSGGAITVDSDPAGEYEETLHKLSALQAALGVTPCGS
ncbi:MAG: aminodeoxychorismate synthase component I [Hyphobacterium sp.]|nr:MAG: aminodeoxychorismate synthase component I [Hyphobacterium sp.]